MKHFAFFLQIKPEPQRRARVTARGQFARAYKTPKQKSYEKELSALMKKEWTRRPIKTPIKLSLTFQMPIPKSTTKKRLEKMLLGEEKHAITPDLSNLVKAIEDVGNGIIWDDDKQIHGLSAHKVYSDTPGICVHIWEEA